MRGFFLLLLTVLLMPALPASAGESALLMVQAPGCTACAKWEREVAPIYEKTEEARHFPLRRMELAAARRTPVFDLSSPPYFTPTFILVENGREVGRIIGYSNDLSFWGLFDIEKRKVSTLAPLSN